MPGRKTNSPIELAVISHIVEENIIFPDSTIEGVLGSPTAYSSVVASRLGTRTGVMTKIGKDMPRHLLQALYEAGVDTRGIKVEGEYTTLSLLNYDKTGNKAILYPKKAPPIFFDDIPSDYLSGEMIYICPMDYDVPLETIEALSKVETMLAVDIGGYGGAHSDTHPDRDEQITHAELKRIIKHCHVVKASSEDCAYFFGPHEDKKKIATSFVEWGSKIGIVTMGEKGAAIATEERIFVTPAISSDIVDCTGAGDVYMGGFLSEYIRTRDVRKSGIFAAATASLVIEGTGGVLAHRMPTRAQVLERIQAARRYEDTSGHKS